MFSTKQSKHRARIFIALGMTAAFAWLLAACGTTEPTPTPVPPTAPGEASGSSDPFQAEWEALIKAAQEEGRLIIARSQASHIARMFGEQFGIRVTISAGGGADTAARIVAEQAVGRFDADITSGGAGSTEQFLLPANALSPVEDWFIHPEVLDKSLWWGNRYYYTDTPQKYTFIPMNRGLESTDALTEVWINTDLVSEEEAAMVKSPADLLDPRWKGRMITQDPAEAGITTPLILVYSEPDLGPEWMERFYGDQEPFMAPNRRFVVDSIALGRYALAAMTSDLVDDLEPLRLQGLPVRQLIEFDGARRAHGVLGRADGRLQILRNPPNPNATKLWVNWYLSREGQTLMNETPDEEEVLNGLAANPEWEGFRRYSLRLDVPWGRNAVDGRWDREDTTIRWPDIEKDFGLVTEASALVQKIVRER